MTKAVQDAVGGERAPIYQCAWSRTGRRRVRLARQTPEATATGSPSTVVRRPSSVAKNGDIVAAMLDSEATVKHFKRVDGQARLLPHNAAYMPIPGNDGSTGHWRHLREANPGTSPPPEPASRAESPVYVLVRRR